MDAAFQCTRGEPTFQISRKRVQNEMKEAAPQPKQMPKPSSKSLKDDDFDDRSSDGSDAGEDLEGFIVEDEPEQDEASASAPDDESNEVAEVLKDAAKLTEGLSSSVVGGRSLRNRETLKKPETYFDVEMYQKLTEADEVREKIQMLKTWAASGEYVCPILKSLTKKTSPDIVDEEYRKAKEALEIPDTDDEDEEEEEEDTEDSDVEIDEGEEEESDGEDEDSEATDSEDDDEDMS
jgi:hypothetical protein